MEWKQNVNISVGKDEKKNDAPESPLKVSLGNLKKFPSEYQKSSDGPSYDKNQNKLVKALDAIIKFSIFAIFFGIPLFFTNVTFQGITFEKQIYFYFFIPHITYNIDHIT